MKKSRATRKRKIDGKAVTVTRTCIEFEVGMFKQVRYAAVKDDTTAADIIRRGAEREAKKILRRS